ncbi:3D domain-containing protein [Peptostreptococcus faecalis]|uniref:3D domain-containing protein n=1 Tax=Peptostreptococcus faecalis TaxID=2045015 RepID=UPI001FA8A3CB|nr:3D domain-containing protein [Peptostreptococcus faecalis]
MKKAISTTLGALILMSTIGTSLIGVSFADTVEAAENVFTTNMGWSKSGNDYIYLNANGERTYGWNRVNGLWYYFNGNGVMVTGVQSIGGKKYNFSDSGVLRNEIKEDANSQKTSTSSNTNKNVFYDKKGNVLGTGKKYVSNASAYTGHTITASGQKPRWGTIAVDPKVIPLGSKVYVPYFDKVFIANDTGGIIKGTKIDIFMTSYSQMMNFGRRNIDIVVLDNK